MRQLSQTIRDILASGVLEVFSMVRLYDLEGNDIFTSTTHPYDIELSDGRTFEANGKLLSVDPPQLTTTVDREQYKISIADAELLYGQYAQTGMVGILVEVIAGFVNSETGAPYENIEDTVILYRGRIDSVAYKITTEVLGERVLVITCTSPMLSLEMKKGVYLSRDFIRQRNAKDSCCDDIYEGSGSLVLKWGRM